MDANNNEAVTLEKPAVKLDVCTETFGCSPNQDEISEIRVTLAELQKELELRRALDEFRQNVYEPFRDDVEHKFHSIEWTWTALKIGIPILAGLLGFFGYLKLESIEDAAKKRVAEKTEWITDAAAGLTIGDKSPSEAADSLQRAFESPHRDPRLDEAIIGELLHDLDVGSMYERGEEFVHSLTGKYSDRYRALRRSDTYNNIGVILQGRAFAKPEVLDSAMSHFKMAIERAAEPRSEWYPNYNLWIAYLMKSELDPAHSSSHMTAAQRHLGRLYTLPNVNAFEWREWETLKRQMWFPRLAQEKPRLFEAARQMLRPVKKSTPRQ